MHRPVRVRTRQCAARARPTHGAAAQPGAPVHLDENEDPAICRARLSGLPRAPSLATHRRTPGRVRVAHPREPLAGCDARAAALLENFDVDGDGALSDEERQTAREARRELHRERFQERFAAADTDGDGELSREEKMAARELHRERVQERRAEIRAQFDTDNDGLLSDEERELAREWIRSGGRI